MASYKSHLCLLVLVIAGTSAKVSLKTDGLKATISNDVVTIEFKADSSVSSVKVNGKNIASTSSRSFYLDWTTSSETVFTPTSIQVVKNTDSLAHFYWSKPSSSGAFHIELHYAMVEGVNGVYSWAKYINDLGSSINVGETRIVYRFNPSILTKGTNTVHTGTLYTYDYLNKQTKIQDETWKLPDGTYYTKYDYAGYVRETPYYGVYGNGYGAFLINPSTDFLAGGPLRQDLMVHQDSLIANYFASSHFGAKGLTAGNGWTHIYGPFLIYFNTGSDDAILADVANRAGVERGNWPYSFVDDSEYPTARGSVSGTVTGQTKAMITLTSTDEDFTVQALGYTYTAQTDGSGGFSISHVRPGTYKVYAYPLAGHGSENLATATVTVGSGNANVGGLNLPEPSNIIWNIGQTDRRSDEFKYSNEVRNYVYETLVPDTLTFTVGQSNPANDWYYAQAKAGIWTIKYEDTKDGKGRTLRVALAAASQSPHMIVTLNGHKLLDQYYENDQSVYRSALQSGTFYSNVIKVTDGQVVSGTNTLTIQISKGSVMYDAISLARD